MSEEKKTYIDDENRYTIERNIFDNWEVTIISDELKKALRNDIKRHKNIPELKRGYGIPSAEFNKCMKKYGFDEYNDKEYPIEYYFRGYTVFKDDSDKEMYIKIVFRNFYDETAVHSFEISPYYEGDKEYNNKRLEIYWKIIIEDIYKAIIAFLMDEDCSGERAKKEVKEKKRRIIIEKEEALAAEYEAKKDRERKLLEDREKKLEKIRERLVKEHEAKKNTKLNNTNYYESNEGYKSANLSNTKLISRFEFNTPVDHRFIIAVKNKEYMDAIDEDERINYSELNDIIALPAWSLSTKQFMCMGLSQSFVKDSILEANITIALIEPTAERDDSYFAGIATLIVKEDAVEIVTICSQIGYKMAGKLLINKIIKIAKKLGKSKIELLSVGNPDTIKFYKRFLFKRVRAENEFAKKGTRKGLIAYRRRITRKKAVSDKPAGGKSASKDAASEPAGKPAGGAGRALSESN